VLTGEYAGDLAVGSPAIAERLVVFAGRLIPEKRALLAIEAIALAQQQIHKQKCVIFGDGPELELVRQAIDKYGLGSSVEAPGFVDQAVLDDCMSKALCLLHPSEREGYGLVVIEAAARGVPALLVQGEDNAATELIVEGVNGFVALEASPEALAENIVRVHRAGRALRNSTANWASDNAGRLSIDSSLRAVLRNYRI
jgi:glycosyltransferase involved in cell wall biosynthesis